MFNTNRCGLLSWGSTKTGGMWNDSAFYTALSGGSCFGQSFVTWFNANRTYSGAPKWWYGMVFLGDASLKPSVFMPAFSNFTFRAIARTNSVILRWTPPAQCGMATNTVHLRVSTSGYPADTTAGALVYLGTNCWYENTGLTPSQTYYYTIWVSHDGLTFVPPP